MKVNGSYIVKHRPNGPDTEEVVEIDFTPPFKRVHMIKGNFIFYQLFIRFGRKNAG